MNASHARGFHVAPYYEPESLTPVPTIATLTSDFSYLAGLSSDPSWLTVSGKPVLFVYNTGTEASCAAINRLESVNAGRFYINAKVFSGYQSCTTQPESWHQYGPASAYDRQGSYSASVSPGFFKFNEDNAAAGPRPGGFQGQPDDPGGLRCPMAADHHIQRVGGRQRGRTRNLVESPAPGTVSTSTRCATRISAPRRRRRRPRRPAPRRPPRHRLHDTHDRYDDHRLL